MVRLTRKGDVNVKIGGCNAQEYHVEKQRRGKEETHTCFIEAKKGEEYSVVLQLPEGCPRMTAELSIDGKRVETKHNGCKKADRSERILFKGYKVSATDASSTRRAFTFDSIPISDSCEKLSSKEAFKYCNIRVELTCKRRIGEYDHRIKTKNYDLPDTTTHHEDTKPALWGVTTTPGRILTGGSHTICHCDNMPDPRALKHTVIFKYRPLFWLVAENIIPSGKRIEEDNASDDDFEVDEERTGKAASLKRAREEEDATSGEESEQEADDDLVSRKERTEKVANQKRVREKEEPAQRHQRARAEEVNALRQQIAKLEEEELLQDGEAEEVQESTQRQQKANEGEQEEDSREKKFALFNDFLTFIDQRQKVEDTEKEKVTVKKEVAVKKEKEEKRAPKQVVDLTPDGDSYVLPSRKIGHTIILSEDEE